MEKQKNYVKITQEQYDHFMDSIKDVDFNEGMVDNISQVLGVKQEVLKSSHEKMKVITFMTILCQKIFFEHEMTHDTISNFIIALIESATKDDRLRILTRCTMLLLIDDKINEKTDMIMKMRD